METTLSNQTLRTLLYLLRLTYGIVPIVAGLDKFTNLLTHWESAIHPGIASIIPPHILILAVGVIEIFAGILVLLRPAIGGYVVAAWLTLIAITLLASGHLLDVGVRDLVMAVGAYTLAKIAKLSS